jgi:hypothetical protein
VRPLVVSLAPSKLQLSVATCLLHHLTVEADQSNFESALPDWLVLPETATNQQRPGRSKFRLPAGSPASLTVPISARRSAALETLIRFNRIREHEMRRKRSNSTAGSAAAQHPPSIGCHGARDKVTSIPDGSTGEVLNG